MSFPPCSPKARRSSATSCRSTGPTSAPFRSTWKPRPTFSNAAPTWKFPAKRSSPESRVGASTIIDEDADLEGPLVIGNQCRIRAGARIGPNTVIGDGCIIESAARLEGAVVWDGSYIGPEAQIEHAIIGSRCTIKRGAQIRDEAVIGDRTLIDVDAIVRPQIKVFPDKTVERGATVTMSIVSGSHGRGTLFRDLGVAGLSNIEITPEFAIRFGLAFGTTVQNGSRIVTGPR